MSFEVDYFTLNDGTTSDNTGYVVLSGTPVDSTNVAMDIIGGTAQALTGDFGVTDSTVRWDTTDFALFGLMVDGDKVRVIYDRS